MADAVAGTSIALEIGCGSGCLLVFVGLLAKSLNREIVLLGTDINGAACRVALKTAAINQVPCDIMCDFLCSSLLDRLENKVDLVVFNPPYVPTEKTEPASDLAYSWAGGPNGILLIDAVVGRVLPKILSPTNGKCYLLVLLQNDPEAILGSLASFGLAGGKVAKRKICGEDLFILRIQKIGSALLEG